MKKLFTISTFVFTIIFYFSPIFAKAPIEITIDDFSLTPSLKNKYIASSNSMFPPKWRYRSKKALKTYGIVKENGNYYLKAKSIKAGAQILKKFKVDLNEYPILSWKWRVQKFPGEENNIDKRHQDDGAAVYAVFSGFFSRKYLKYTWSNHHSKDTQIDYSGSLKIFVLRDSKDKGTEWIEEKRNIFADFKKVFGKNPPKMKAIAILTDSDQTESYAEADYDDFKMIKID